MKKTFAVVLIAGVIATGNLALASSPEPAKAAPKVGEVEANIAKLQQSFSGLVRETEAGLVLETQEGEYLLKGLSLQEIIGKEVYVTGVVKNDKETNTIYVVKADVKS